MVNTDMSNEQQYDSDQAFVAAEIIEYDLIASCGDGGRKEFVSIVNSPLAILGMMGIAAIGTMGLFLVLVVSMVSSSMDGSRNRYSHRDAAFELRDAPLELQSESGIVSGTLDQRDIRNSVISVDGEVLNFPN